MTQSRKRFKQSCVPVVVMLLLFSVLGGPAHVQARPVVWSGLVQQPPELVVSCRDHNSVTLSERQSPQSTCPPPVWRVVERPTSEGFIEAANPNDVWYFGNSILHFDGSTWNPVPYPMFRNAPFQISAASIQAVNNVWAVGTWLGGFPTFTAGAIEHWNGSAWQLIECYGCPPALRPNYYQGNFEGVIAFGPDGAIAAGYESLDGPHNPIFVNCSQSNCDPLATSVAGHLRKIDKPVAVSRPASFHAISGVSSIDLWVGGDKGYPEEGLTTLLAHWNGGSIAEVASPQVGPVTRLAAGASDSVWAIGDSGVLYWNGNAWSISDLTGVNDIAARAADDAWAVGDGTKHWDGHSWTAVPAPPVSYHSVSIVSANDVWASGVDAQGPVILHYSSPAEFTDVLPGSVFYPFVHCLACAGIINGYEDGTFRPNRSVSRGQLAKFVANAAGYSETYTQSSFSDVQLDNPFFQQIERLAHRGIINGYPDGSFHPNGSVTRQQAAKFISNAKGYSETYESSSFNDVGPDNPFFQQIERLAHRNIVGGYSNGSFRPGNDLTRGQAAKVTGGAFFPDCQPTRQAAKAGDKVRSGK